MPTYRVHIACDLDALSDNQARTRAEQWQMFAARYPDVTAVDLVEIEDENWEPI